MRKNAFFRENVVFLPFEKHAYFSIIAVVAVAGNPVAFFNELKFCLRWGQEREVLLSL